jgi:hypothetical protein
MGGKLSWKTQLEKKKKNEVLVSASPPLELCPCPYIARVLLSHLKSWGKFSTFCVLVITALKQQTLSASRASDGDF